MADAEGNFDWGAPDQEVHRFVNELERPIGTYLYGRRMYEVIATGRPPRPAMMSRQRSRSMRRSGIQPTRSSPKSLQQVSSARTSIQRKFDPKAIQQLKAAASRDISVSGPTLAARALKQGLVDECHLFLSPIVVGGGNPALPENVRLGLELLDERRFGNGVVHLHYRVKA